MKEHAQYHAAQSEARRQTVYAEWHVTGFASRQPCPVALNGLDRDLCSRVADTHDQHIPGLQLRGAAVLERMELHDVCVQLRSKRWSARPLVVAHRDDDVFRLESLVPRDDDNPVAESRQAIDAHVRSHRQCKALRVRFEIVGHLILRWKIEGRRGEWHAVQTGKPCGGEQPERIPSVAPRVADMGTRIKDDEWNASAR